jgi:DNA polymerase-3 subunit gamma/tau
LAARDAAAALAELDAAVAGGVEIGQLLDQLIGYFRDVMAVAVGCPREQMLYAVPSQAEEVEAIGRQLGLATILAMVQILDQTAARLRLSLHGRTLVEMAVVRICELEKLDDLAALVAELRGEPGGVAPRPAEPAKKNAEPRPPSTSIGAIPPLPQPTTPIVAPPSASVDTPTPATRPPAAPSNGAAPEASESVLKQFQLAVEAAKSGNVEPQAAPSRVSRRQQTAEQLQEVSERPFVQRAIELFDVAPGQYRYSPPEGE